MSQLEPKIYQVLSGDADVAAVVSGRIYPVILPQGATFPAITYNRVAVSRVHALTGYTGLESAIVQIDCWAETYAAAKELARKARLAMQGAETFNARPEGDRDLFEDEAEIYRISSDFECWNEED